jgi:hypothetical protein
LNVRTRSRQKVLQILNNKFASLFKRRPRNLLLRDPNDFTEYLRQQVIIALNLV